MTFLKFSFLIIFASLVVGLTPTILKLMVDKNELLGEVFFVTKMKGNFVSASKTDKPTRTIFYKNFKIPVYVSDSETERTKGLGGLNSIPRNFGMIFIFNNLDYQGIWMKDMLFPIDIVWIDENKKIVHLEKNISPNTFPKIFISPVKALYVLELNQGMADYYNLKLGEKIILI